MSEKKDFKILVEKEYYKLSKKSKTPTIGLLMMVKNEKKRLKISLDSVTGHVDCFIIYDTGSTDNTIDIIKNHCEEHKINLYLITGDFVDFSTSRNVSLSYADTIDVQFLLLLDTNDELRGGDILKKFAKKQLDTENTGYLTCQEWFSGKYDKYFNMRFIKNKSGWRYRGSVHEYLKNTTYEDEKDAPTVIRMPSEIILYQDRTQDDDKTGKRFVRDKRLLLAEYEKDRKDPRTLFYLAQTCACLKHLEDALYYYKLRSNLEGFQEEKFHAYLRCGEISEQLNYNWHDAMAWYMKALEHSQRAEPYIKLAEHYQKNKKFDLAYMFISTACKLSYPEHCILFVDKYSYTYIRWHILGIVAYYAGKYKEGKLACEKAIEYGLNKEIDNKNLKFYIEKLGEIDKSPTKMITKAQFINLEIDKLKKENPSMTAKKMIKLANTKWKKSRKMKKRN